MDDSIFTCRVIDIITIVCLIAAIIKMSLLEKKIKEIERNYW